MKTALIISCFLHVVNMSVIYGQNKPKFGIVIGLNSSQIKTSLSTNNSLLRYSIGGSLEKKFSRKVNLIGFLMYSRQGSTEGPLVTTNNKLIHTFDYINLPLLLRVNLIGEKFFLEAGGQLGYLVQANTYSSDRPSDKLAYTHTTRLDYGLVGGIGYRVGKHLVADIRYYYGMSPLRENYTGIDPQTGLPAYYQVEKWYNRVYNINVGYYF